MAGNDGSRVFRFATRLVRNGEPDPSAFVGGDRRRALLHSSVNWDRAFVARERAYPARHCGCPGSRFGHSHRRYGREDRDTFSCFWVSGVSGAVPRLASADYGISGDVGGSLLSRRMVAAVGVWDSHGQPLAMGGTCMVGSV